MWNSGAEGGRGLAWVAWGASDSPKASSTKEAFHIFWEKVSLHSPSWL